MRSLRSLVVRRHWQDKISNFNISKASLILGGLFLYLYGKTFAIVLAPECSCGVSSFNYKQGFDCTRPVQTMSSTFILTKKSIPVLLLALCFSCAGGKDSVYAYEQEPPFAITASYFQKWVAGVQEGGSGVNVYLDIDAITEEVEFRHLYFRNKKERAVFKPTSPDKITGYFKKAPKRDVIMDSDPTREANNTPKDVFPFHLKENEAVLSFYHKGEEKYLKITEIEEKPMIAYPSSNPNGIE